LRGIGTLWFLPALLGGEIMFLTVRDKSIWYKTILFILCLLVTEGCKWWFFNTSLEGHIKDFVFAPIHVVQDMANAFIYIGITYQISNKWGKQILQRNRLLLGLIGVLLLFIDFYIMNFASFQDPLGWYLFVLCNFIGGFGALFFFTSIETFKPISLPLSYCGKNSLIIMAMHWELFTLVMLFDKYYMGHSSYNGFITLLYFIVSLPIMCCIIELINRKFKFIIGK
jgi:hypothetical protein